VVFAAAREYAFTLMLRRVHFVFGILAVVAFLLTGQVMGRHHPRIDELPAELRLMFVSRHIYLLGAALVNLVLGLYLQMHQIAWRRALQVIGSLLILFSAVSSLLAFVEEPPLGLAGRSWRSLLGMIALFAGVMTHLVASVGASRRIG